MHGSNRRWWKGCEKKYTPFFRDPSCVIEFGSLNENGSIRDHFQCSNYVGVDWRPGRPNGVESKTIDLISLAHEVPFAENSFDTVASASMLEHDPFWIWSLEKMVNLLKPDGVMFLSWGAAHNSPHHDRSSPVNRFHALPAGKAIKRLEGLGMYVHDFRYETHFKPSFQSESVANHGCGEVCLIAFKNPSLAIGERCIDRLLPADDQPLDLDQEISQAKKHYQHYVDVTKPEREKEQMSDEEKHRLREEKRQRREAKRAAKAKKAK